MKSAKENLQSLIDKMQCQCDQTTVAKERKEMANELQETENESKLPEILSSANEMIFMLESRLAEAKHDKIRLSKKLGIPIPAGRTKFNQLARIDLNREVREGVASLTTDAEALSIQEEFLSEDDSYNISRGAKAITPPTITLPKFYGIEEKEFTEFWAVFETLVHNNRSITTVEKMLLLKDSLRGNSDAAIKGIQLIPQNYNWMIETLKKKS
ncbi:hypothetical protein Y032_0784g2332 [Ancylostoma ceylanicum]|uniref:Uncharacterized protein n=1 Tax=Ancylostoma ceylanicum TaxID=53326 RepID=A0A016WES1_9BILA|nr:hypothetical protein Y032_0784g2332 [Ancylostoma ceylanicum]